MDVAATKAELRASLLAARRARPAGELEAARSAICRHVLARAAADCVAAYVPMRTEPGSIELLAALASSERRVLVPITLPDRDLDWARWSPAGLGAPLGREAVASAGLVLVPALAVGRDGTRLGRGGGSYDRALPRVPADALTAALVFDGEVLDTVPVEEWDAPVAAAVTPSGWVELAGNDRFASWR